MNYWLKVEFLRCFSLEVVDLCADLTALLHFLQLEIANVEYPQPLAYHSKFSFGGLIASSVTTQGSICRECRPFAALPRRVPTHGLFVFAYYLRCTRRPMAQEVVWVLCMLLH